MRLTDKTVRSLTPDPNRQYDVRESGGLGIRVSPGGTKTWIYWCERAGRRRRISLGRFPAMSRREAGIALANAVVSAEQDLSAHPKPSLATDLTVAHLADLYVDGWAKPRKKTWCEDHRLLQKHVLPTLGDRIAHEVRRRDVADLLNSLMANGLTTGANRVLAVTRRMFNWAIEQDLIEHSPCARIRPPAKERSRDRVLSEGEIRLLWTRLDDCHMSTDTRTAVRLQLATALRVGEVTGVRWSEIDLDSGWWTIPRERSKNGIAHRVPLTPLTRELFMGQVRATARCEWIFPGSRPGVPMTTQAVSKALHRNRDRIGISEPFVPHDLRRTAATHMARLGVPQETIARCLNHADRSVTAIYVRHGYDAEKKSALEAWNSWLLRLTQPVKD